MIVGSRIKEHLLSRLDADQPGKSSHWQNMLKDFSYCEASGLRGIHGFGTLSKRNLPFRLFHTLMSAPLRLAMKRRFDFADILKNAEAMTAKQGRALDHDVLRQVFTIALCRRQIPFFPAHGTHLVIGDGFGTLAGLILTSGGQKVISINRHEVLLVDYLFTRPIVPDVSTALVENASDMDEALSDDRITLVYLSADSHHLIRNVELASVFNIASMQEMNPAQIAEYFAVLRSCKSDELYFYCCNRIEKILPDGTKTAFFEYPWEDTDEIILDELCPWHRRYYSITPPFYRRYAGSIQHRLLKMKNS